MVFLVTLKTIKAGFVLTFSQLKNTDCLTAEQKEALDKKLVRYTAAARARMMKIFMLRQLPNYFDISFEQHRINRYYKNCEYKEFLMDARWDLWSKE